MPNLDDYFRRIAYRGPATPTLETLQAICWLHQTAIPFENLDIALLRRPISLEPEAIWDKLVGHGRGGFCFEQNGLLAIVLGQIGFGVTMGYATWQPEQGERIVPFDHQVLRVEIPGDAHPWLADVGFGRDTPSGPLPLHPGAELRIERTGFDYRLSAIDDSDLQWTVEQTTTGEPWRTLYDLDLRPRQMGDFEHRSQFNQTSPESHFTQSVICSKPLNEGRVTVTSTALILTRECQREETPLTTRADMLAAIEQWFGIRIKESELPEERLVTGSW